MKLLHIQLTLLVIICLITGPGQAQVVINEIYINPDANDGDMFSPNTGEWIELYNNSASTVDVSCWVFCDGDFCVTLPDGTNIASGDFFLVGSPAGAACGSCDFPGLTLDLDWATCGCTSGISVGTFRNDGEQVVLFDDTGSEVNSILWSSGQPLPASQLSAAMGSCTAQTLVFVPLSDPGAMYENIVNAGGQGESKARTTNGGPTWATESAPSPGASNTPLPISLLSFDATASQNHVNLSWSTASELNNHYFTIERSVDALDFSTILTVDGAGNSTTRMDYYAADRDPLPGKSYYRLRQTDFDGTTETFDIVPVTVDVSVTNGLALYPQPATVNSAVKARFSLAIETETEVVVTTAKGQVVHKSIVRTGEGMNEIQVPSLDLPGVYIITLNNPQFFLRRQLIIY